MRKDRQGTGSCTARPYDISANGFFFETAEEYNAKAANLRNASGWPVEEFEIQFIDGDEIDARLFESLGVHQGNFPAYLEVIEDWSEDDKIKTIIAVGEVGYSFTLGEDSPDQFDIDLYEIDSLRDLAYSLWKKACSEKSRNVSSITWTMTPSPAILAWTTAKPSLITSGMYIAVVNTALFLNSIPTHDEQVMHNHLLCILTMGATRLATRPTLSAYKVFARSFNPVIPGLRFFCGLNPAYPLIARKGSDILPCLQRIPIRS